MTTKSKPMVPGRFARGLVLVFHVTLVTPLARAASGMQDDAKGEALATIPQQAEPLPGRVVGDAVSAFRFESVQASNPIDLARITDVTFRPSDPEPSESPAPFRLDLGLRGRLSGRLESISEETVQIETELGGPLLTLRREGVRAVIQRPGEALVMAESFESAELDPKRWARVGKPQLSSDEAHQGRQCLVLAPGGSAATIRLEEPVASGRFEVAYREDERIARGQTRFVDLTFLGDGGPRSIQVLLGWEDPTLGVRTRGPEPALAVQPLLRRQGWHRLTVVFNARRTDIAVDGVELAHGDGPGGQLTEIRLATDATQAGLDGTFDDLRLVQFAESTSLVEIEPAQDEVRLISGDQVFGRLVAADDASIRLDLDGRRATFGWSNVSGIHLQRRQIPSDTIEGLWIRVEWRPLGVDSRGEPDHVEGVLKAIGPETATVAVPYAGEITIPADRLIRLVPLAQARKRILAPGHYHVGNRLVLDLDPPQPEGTRIEIPFDLPQAPEGLAAIVLDVVQVIGIEGDPNYSKQVRDGELRTYLSLNGERLGDLNSQIHVRNDEPMRIRIPVPEGTLRPGPNTLSFEQTGLAADPSQVDNLGVLGIALESFIPGSKPSRAEP